MIRSSCQLYRILLTAAILLIPVINTLAQARLILNNGGIINITQGAYLVIDNPAANAITRNSSGHIISEGENNVLQWNIGTTAASYTIPWGYSTTNYIPVSFTTSAATGSGFFKFSTYRTAWNNSSQLPSGMTSFANTSGSDNSAKVLDRFWQANAQSYTTKPTLTNLLLTYIDVEHSVASNTITEGNLKAQRYNSTSNIWSDYTPAGTVNTTNNTVTVASVAAGDLFPWWVLVDQSSPLPIDLLSFSAEPTGTVVKLDWTTVSELNNDNFTIQRSSGETDFADIGKVKGAGSSSGSRQYNFIDLNALPGRSYYRLKQTDFDGTFKYSDVKKVDIDETAFAEITIFPNPTTTNTFSLDFHNSLQTPTSVTVYDLLGKVVFTDLISSGVRTYTIHLADSPSGVYVVKTLNTQSNSQQVVLK
jgi:hypothetical protein